MDVIRLRMSQNNKEGTTMRHTIKTEILQTVINYLATKPYNEVQALVAAIKSDARVEALAQAEAQAEFNFAAPTEDVQRSV